MSFFDIPSVTCLPWCYDCKYYSYALSGCIHNPQCKKCRMETYYDRSISHDINSQPRRFVSKPYYRTKRKRALNNSNQLTFNF